VSSNVADQDKAVKIAERIIEKMDKQMRATAEHFEASTFEELTMIHRLSTSSENLYLANN